MNARPGVIIIRGGLNISALEVESALGTSSRDPSLTLDGLTSLMERLTLVDELPRSATGKLQKFKLKELL